MNHKKIGLKKLSTRHLRTMRRRRKISSTSQEDSELSEGKFFRLYKMLLKNENTVYLLYIETIKICQMFIYCSDTMCVQVQQLFF